MVLAAAAAAATLALFVAALLGTFGSAPDIAAGCSFDGPSDLSHSYMIGMDSFTYDVTCPSPESSWSAQAQIQQALPNGDWSTVSTIRVFGIGSTGQRIAHLLAPCRNGKRYRGQLDLGQGESVASYPPEGAPLC